MSDLKLNAATRAIDDGKPLFSLEDIRKAMQVITDQQALFSSVTDRDLFRLLAIGWRHIDKQSAHIATLEARLRELREILSDKPWTEREIVTAKLEALEIVVAFRDAQIDRLIGLLKIANCPNCDGSGAYTDNNGEPCQCQWCFERYNETLPAPPKEAE